MKAPAAVNPHAVRLLTIHGAKGLEADAVLLLDTHTAVRNADSMSVLVDWLGEAAVPHKFVFLVSESKPPLCALEALATEQAARSREELNALYVAMTRAKNTLALSSIVPHREAPDSWWQRLVDVADSVEVHQSKAAPDEMVVFAPDSFELPELPAFTPTVAPKLMTDADTESARIGKAMHRMLEWDDLSPAASSKAARQFGLTPQQQNDAQAMAQRIRHGDAAWAWDASRLQWQGNEVELTHQGQTFRLDRLVQRKDAGHAGDWWVLDYKSALNPQLQADLVTKMQSYKAALQAIYPAQTVKAAFLTADGKLVSLD